MIKITILIPLEHNDKTSVLPTEIAEYVHDIEKLAGGCTIDSQSVGSYVMDSGAFQQDRLFSVWVIGEHTLRQPMRAIAQRIATELRQESVYLEWHDVNVEFAKPPRE